MFTVIIQHRQFSGHLVTDAFTFAREEDAATRAMAVAQYHFVTSILIV